MCTKKTNIRKASIKAKSLTKKEASKVVGGIRICYKCKIGYFGNSHKCPKDQEPTL